MTNEIEIINYLLRFEARFRPSESENLITLPPVDCSALLAYQTDDLLTAKDLERVANRLLREHKYPGFSFVLSDSRADFRLDLKPLLQLQL